MKLGYFPGCLAESSAKEYDSSLKALFDLLEIGLQEVHGWNCCGAFEASSLDPYLGFALPARNLALYGKSCDKLIISCSACISNHAKTNHRLKEDPEFKEKIEKIIEDVIKDIEVKHPLEILKELPKGTIEKKIKKPLSGMKFIPYYGCNFLRPFKVLKADNPENPNLMEHMIELCKGEVLPFLYKAKCCGGALLLADKQLSIKMTAKLWEEIEKLKPDAVVVLCPQCSMTLETLAPQIDTIKGNIPVVYITQLMGLAMGLPIDTLGLEKNLISTEKLIEKVENINRQTK